LTLSLASLVAGSHHIGMINRRIILQSRTKLHLVHAAALTSTFDGGLQYNYHCNTYCALCRPGVGGTWPFVAFQRVGTFGSVKRTDSRCALAMGRSFTTPPDYKILGQFSFGRFRLTEFYGCDRIMLLSLFRLRRINWIAP